MERLARPTTYVNTYVAVPKNISGFAPKSWIIWINVPQMASVRQKRWSKILDQDPHSVIQLDPRCEDSLRHRNVGSFGSFVITHWLNVGKNEWSKWSNIAMTQTNVSTPSLTGGIVLVHRAQHNTHDARHESGNTRLMEQGRSSDAQATHSTSLLFMPQP